jgi:DNA-binding YbaB/EbfC family protein
VVGFPKSMTELFEQAQSMQKKMTDLQAEIEKKEVEASAGGGMVSVSVNGGQLVTKIKIDKEVVNPEDVQMLEDLVKAATNEALRKSKDLMKEELSKIAGGMNLPIPGFN